MAAAAASSSAWFQCRDCRGRGELVPVELTIAGERLAEAPLLPRCACFLRVHRGKLPAAVSSLLASVPEMPSNLIGLEARKPSALQAEDGSSAACNMASRLIYSVDRLPPQLTVRVYRSECQETALLGTIPVNPEHKLSDVMQSLKDTLGVALGVQLYRGIDGEKLKVPIHQKQLPRLALPFFPTAAHHLLID